MIFDHSAKENKLQLAIKLYRADYCAISTATNASGSSRIVHFRTCYKEMSYASNKY